MKINVNYKYVQKLLNTPTHHLRLNKFSSPRLYLVTIMYLKHNSICVTAQTKQDLKSVAILNSERQSYPKHIFACIGEWCD